MSRIGKNPVIVPQGVEVTIEGQKVTVKGPKGTLSSEFLNTVKIEKVDNTIVVTRENDNARNVHGLTRTLINNMVVGVTEGYSKTLEINGIGYKAVKQGTKLVLSLGYSHPVEFMERDGITFELPNQTTIIVKGIDKQLVGQIAAEIREKRMPEPYKGKGIKYSYERIIRKQGKAAGKK